MLSNARILGMSHELDHAAWRAALKRGRDLVQRGLALFLNFTPSSVHNSAFDVKKTKALCREMGVDMSQLVFEVTEAEKVNDFDFLKKVMQEYRAGTGAYEGRREGGFGFMGLNAMTPETEHSTHYFWSGAHNYHVGNPEMTQRLRKSLEVTFGEDKVVVESQYAAVRANPDAPQVMIASDAGMVASRKLITELIDKERSDVRETV